MNSLYLYFFKQYKNIWKNLSLRIRIEILILFVIYFSFFTTRLISLFNEQLNNQNTTEFGFVQFVLHSLVLLISISIPFIHLYIIPRQPGITYYKSLPLNSLNTFWLLFFSHYKYQVVGLILVLPIFMAMLFTINIFITIYFFVSVLIFQTIFVLYVSFLTTHEISNRIVIFKYYMLIIVFFFCYCMMYFYTNYYFLIDPMFFIFSLFFLILNWKKKYQNWDIFIMCNQSNSELKREKTGFLSYPALKKNPFPQITPLLAKEILNYVRNRKYIGNQIFSFIIYSSIFIFCYIKFQDEFVLYGSALTILYIWQHFSLQFNEKYVKADSAFFFKTLPFKYYQLWIAKFISEFLFVIILLLFLLIFYLLVGFKIFDIYQSLIGILLFSLMILATIINFKIIFFDRPRFAGYAYHIFIIFIVVMSINYYLVGPIMAIVLLTYFTFYSYREFAR